ncbi:MAG: hypothetical protein JKY03_11060 [Aureispira sp.]|nr:hypothetical protein [Aureispira sp.]
MLRFFCLIIIACSFSACQKGPIIDIPFRAYVIIPAGLNTGFSHHFVLRDIPGINREDLIDAQPSYVTMTVEYGENNLDFIQQAYFYAIDGTDRQEMAYQTNLPITNAGTIQLYPSILDMKDHVTKNEFEMELKVIFRSIPITETRIIIDFGVQATLGE